MKNRELNLSIALLHAMLTRTDIEPEQKGHVERAMKALKIFRRKPNPRPHEVARCVREVVEALSQAFLE
jgi:hypothetical protein